MPIYMHCKHFHAVFLLLVPVVLRESSREVKPAVPAQGSPDRAPCPDAQHKRSSVKSQLASNQQGSLSALVDSANPLHKATGQAVCRVIKQKQKPDFS